MGGSEVGRAALAALAAAVGIGGGTLIALGDSDDPTGRTPPAPGVSLPAGHPATLTTVANPEIPYPEGFYPRDPGGVDSETLPVGAVGGWDCIRDTIDRTTIERYSLGTCWHLSEGGVADPLAPGLDPDDRSRGVLWVDALLAPDHLYERFHPARVFTLEPGSGYPVVHHYDFERVCFTTERGEGALDLVAFELGDPQALGCPSGRFTPGEATRIECGLANIEPRLGIPRDPCWALALDERTRLTFSATGNLEFGHLHMGGGAGRPSDRLPEGEARAFKGRPFVYHLDTQAACFAGAGGGAAAFKLFDEFRPLSEDFTYADAWASWERYVPLEEAPSCPPPPKDPFGVRSRGR